MARSGRFTALARMEQFLPNFSGKWGDICTDNRGDICIAQALPSQSELVRLGQSYKSTSTSTTNNISSNTPPSASGPVLLLINGESDGGKSYILSAITLEVSVTGSIAAFFGIAVQYFQKGEVTTVPIVNHTIHPVLGRGKYRGLGKFMTPSSVGDQGRTFQIGTAFMNTNTSYATAAVTANIDGRIILAPGCALSMIGTYNINDIAQGRFTILWHEAQLGLA